MTARRVFLRARRCCAALWFALGSAATVCAVDDASAAIPTDADANWTLGIAQFQSVNMSRENLYLASSFPLLIRERVISVKKHHFPSDELLALKKTIVNTELKKEINGLLSLQKARDEALFGENKDYQIRKINEDYTAASARAKARISFLRSLDPGRVSVAAEKPVAVKDNAGRLFPPPPFSALRYCDEIDVDALLWGTVEEIRGYLYCELYVFDRLLEKNIFTFKEAGLPQELFASLEKSLPDLITAAMGREWASLLIDVDPAFSFIKVNGALVGMGTAEITDLTPGEIAVDIQAPGYESRRETVTLAHLERRVLEYRLVKGKEESVLITSVPAAANAYFNSLWIGKTPLVVAKPGVLTRLEIREEGFRNAYARVGPDTPSSFNFALVRGAVDFQKLKDSKRSRYYTSLAAFLLSLPFPVMCFTLARDYYYTASHLGENEFFNAGYYGTLFLSGVLFVNMIYDMIRYLASRNESIG